MARHLQSLLDYNAPASSYNRSAVAEEYENFLIEPGDREERRDEARPFSHEEMATCENCLRANPPTRADCFYCGAALPAPAEDDARTRRLHLRQPEEWEDGYNVVLCARATVTEELLREAADLLRLQKADALRILEAAEPLPLVRLQSAEEARLVAERLAGLGLRAMVVADGDLSLKEEARRRARAFEFRDDALYARASGSNEVWRFEWRELLLLVTGRLVLRRVETEERRKGYASEVVEAREMTGDAQLLDIYSRTGATFRVASDSFDFSCLGARKSLVAAGNFKTLIFILQERAPAMSVDDSYNRLRHALAPVWPPEERKESGGLRRERPGRFNTEAVMKSDNEMQFTRYSRLRYLMKQLEGHG